MGALYRPKYRDRHGVMQTGDVWWVRFRQHGKTVRQSTETTSEAKAKAFLREREGKVALNMPVNVKADRLTLAEAADLIRHDYTANGHKSADTLELRLTHLVAHFGAATRLSRITTGGVETYKMARLEAGAASATVNREVSILARMGTLARRQFGLVVPFVVAKLRERNAREGFFEEDAFAAVCRQLRPELVALATVARLTGWRKSELRSRQWRHVDFTAGWLRLEPEETKNRDGRMFPLIPELRTVLDAQRARVEALQKATDRVIPWVFCRDDGAPVGDFKKAWTTARQRAGVPGRLFHDFRRTAVRNLIRAGIPETVAMKLTGHRTRAVFQRYAIVEEGMLQEAGARLTAARLARESGKVRAQSGKVTELKA
jgi:integrase